MKQYLIKGFAVAGIAMIAVPAFAQKDIEKDKNNKERQTIVINRSGDTNEKTVIEISGDKVLINGKEAKDNKDVSVNVHKYKDWTTLNSSRVHTMSLFSEDSNRAMLGVVTDEDDKGAEITSVSKESAAEKAGLKKGDIITKIGDSKIEDTDDVSKAVRAHKPGDKVDVTVLRDGKEQKLTAELMKWKGVNMNTITIPQVPAPPIEYRAYGGRPKLGLSVQDTEDGKGVKVLDVDDESAAAKAGIKENDVITHINDKEIENTDELRREVSRTSQQYTYNMQVIRNGKTQTVEVKIPRKLKTADL